ncbi:unnamed protein product, partial [Chrysoparadoxa australica]
IQGIGVTHVLNAAQQLPNFHKESLVYHHAPMLDTPSEDLAPYRKQAVSFLQHVDEIKGRCLVHCIAGCSRSVSLVLLYLMEARRVNLRSAYTQVQHYRTIMQPNEGFRFQLAMIEVELFGYSTVNKLQDKLWDFYKWN